MTSNDSSYFRQRAVTERAMALASERENVREIHEELARQYQALAEQAERTLDHLKDRVSEETKSAAA